MFSERRISSNAVQLLNALEPSEVTLSGIYTLFSAVQPESTELPILVTLSGITKSVRAVQPENALLRIAVTLCGMTTFCSVDCFITP